MNANIKTKPRGLTNRLRKLGWTPKQIRIAWSMRQDRLAERTLLDCLFDCNEWLCAYMGRCAPVRAKLYLRETPN